MSTQWLETPQILPIEYRDLVKASDPTTNKTTAVIKMRAQTTATPETNHSNPRT